MRDDADRLLWNAGLVYLAAFTLHTVDHLRRGSDSITEALYVAGYLSSLLSIALIVLVLTRHRLAPLAAVAIGLPQALAFVAAHFLPEWSAISDSFVEGGASAVSIVAGLAEIAGALLVGLAGLNWIRQHGLSAVTAAPTGS
jgi:hypothetical protein